MENAIVKHSAVTDPRVCGVWGNEFLLETETNKTSYSSDSSDDFELDIPFQAEMEEDHRRMRARERKAVMATEIAELERQKKIRNIKSAIVTVLCFGVLIAAEAICRCPNF